MMKLKIIVIYSLCIFLSFMSYPCASQQVNEKGDGFEELTTMQVLPRKLKVINEPIVKDSGKKVEFQPSFTKQDVASPGNMETKEMNPKNGSQEEFDEAEYFTMDYKRVKKRRPIHNKSLPSGAASP